MRIIVQNSGMRRIRRGEGGSANCIRLFAGAILSS